MKLLLLKGVYFDSWQVPPPVYSLTSSDCSQSNALGEHEARGLNSLDFETTMTEELQRHVGNSTKAFQDICVTELSFVKAIK